MNEIAMDMDLKELLERESLQNLKRLSVVIEDFAPVPDGRFGGRKSHERANSRGRGHSLTYDYYESK